MLELLLKPLKPLVDKLVQEKINEMLTEKPNLLKEIKIISVKNGKKLNVWEALEIAIEISFCVGYVDKNGLDDFESYRYNDLASFRQGLKKFKPLHDRFSSASLHVKPEGSTEAIIENLIDWKKIYPSTEMNKIIDPLIKWIEAKPELLI